MKLNDFYYELPQELIAQVPLENRSDSKLLVLDKNSGEIIHEQFSNIIEYFNEGDCLVLNDTRVMPARLLGNKEGSGGKIEILLLKRMNADIWEVILKPGKKARVGTRFVFGENELYAEIVEVLDDGNRLIRFEYEGVFEKILDNVGLMPLPPYITSHLEDKERYQTVYSNRKGSAAAPTAGLHFTNDLLEKIKNKGVVILYVTLHVGLGTFRPVKVENINEHKMHSEFFSISQQTCDKINNAKIHGGKIVAVGTTTCRVLESVGKNGELKESSGNTDIFIFPGYKFKVIDNLITNFHLPESTLIMLVSAMAGYENTMNAYKKAVDEKYRFFSFGDAMFIKN